MLRGITLSSGIILQYNWKYCNPLKNSYNEGEIKGKPGFSPVSVTFMEQPKGFDR
jgi:hypothetical protein